MKIIFVFTALLPLFLNGQTWQQVNDFPGTKRDDAVSFTINGKTYVGTGLDEGFQTTRDFYSFDYGTGLWDVIASLPIGKERQYATAFTDSVFGYVFGGIDGAGNFLNDLWRYNPTLNTWMEMSPMPSGGRSGAASFIFSGNSIFIVGGKNNSSQALKEAWVYGYDTDSWYQTSSLPGAGLWRGVGFSNVDGSAYGYVGLGKDSLGATLNSFYRFDSFTWSWSIESNLITSPKSYVASAQIGSIVYLFGGVDDMGMKLATVERIDLINLNITPITSFTADTRKGGVAFSFGNDLFISTGVSDTERFNETWVLQGALELKDPEQVSKLVVTQSKDEIHFNISNENINEFLLITTEGKIVIHEVGTNIDHQNVSNLPYGNYLYYLTSNKNQYSGSIFIN